MQRLFAVFTGVDPKLGLRLGLAAAAAALLTFAYCSGRGDGRQAEAEETATETIETIDRVERSYEQIDDTHAAGDGDARGELRDGSFLTGGSARGAPLSTD